MLLDCKGPKSCRFFRDLNFAALIDRDLNLAVLIVRVLKNALLIVRDLNLAPFDC